jgi:hypothetical protein
MFHTAEERRVDVNAVASSLSLWRLRIFTLLDGGEVIN